MIRVLYVHGYLGSANGSASKLIREELDRRGIDYSLDAPSIPITNPSDALNMVKTNDYDIIVSSSIGSFYTMHNSGTFKILVNPALTNTMIDLNDNYPNGMIDEISSMEDKFFNDLDIEMVDETYFVFGTNDTIAHNREKFTNHYRTSNIYEVKDMAHKLNYDGAIKVVDIIENIVNDRM